MVRGATVYVTFVIFLPLALSFAHAAAGVDVTSLALDPANPSTLYAGTTGRGVLKSANGGATWSPTGLTDTPIASLAIDPLVPTTLYAVTPVGVLRSVDGAQSWTGTLLLNEHFSGFLYGFFNPAFATFGSLAIAPRADPAAPPALYAGFSFLTWDAFTEYVWGEVVWTTDGLCQLQYQGRGGRSFCNSHGLCRNCHRGVQEHRRWRNLEPDHATVSATLFGEIVSIYCL